MNTASLHPERPALDAVQAIVRGHDDDADVALARLTAAGLYPWPAGDGAPRWYCKRCDGTGALSVPGLGVHPCRYGVGHLARPLRVAKVVAVASLGTTAMLDAVQIAKAMLGDGTNVVWRAMSESDLRGHHAETWGARIARPFDAEISIPQAFSTELNGPRPFEVCTFYNPAVRAAWPMLRNLYDLGFHVVGVSGRDVVLAVVLP
jgi:hypothetical protein